MIVDFHVHSTASDGTFAPRDIAADAASGGFAAIDHQGFPLSMIIQGKKL